jgi:ribosome maturation factor RimP
LELEKERKGIEKKFFDLCSSVVQEAGYELYGMDYINSQFLLRLFIQDPISKTAGLEDCSKVDRALTPFVEEENWMPEELTLEVSSPGVYRDVKEARWFSEFLNQRFCMVLSKKLELKDFVSESVFNKKLTGDKKVFLYLKTFDGEKLGMSSKKDGDVELNVLIDNIKKANVEPLWDEIKE